MSTSQGVNNTCTPFTVTLVKIRLPTQHCVKPAVNVQCIFDLNYLDYKPCEAGMSIASRSGNK